MQGQPHVCTLSGSLGLLLVMLLMACPSAAAQTPTAPPAASEAPDAGMLSAPEASPKRAGSCAGAGSPTPRCMTYIRPARSRTWARKSRCTTC